MKRLLVLLLGLVVGFLAMSAAAVLPATLSSTAPHPLKAVAISDSQIRLSWPARFTNAGGFMIERSMDAKHFVEIGSIPAMTNRYTDEGLLSATTYYYRLRSHTTNGDSPYSNVVHAHTRGAEGHLSLTSWGLPVGDPPAKQDNLVAVAAGLHHQVALQKDGKVTAWGDVNATNGQVKFPKGLDHVMAITAGGYHSLALKENGTVVAWGANTNQQATPPAGLKNVIAIAAGETHSLALKADGTVVGWGDNSFGQCTPPTNLNHVVAIAAGGDHSLALKNDGTVVAWGQLSFRWPRPDLTNIVAIAAGVNHDLLLHRDGTVEAWIPPWGWWWMWNLPPFDLTNVVAIAAGETHNLALKSNGTVVGWGYNQNGGGSVPEGLSKVAFIAAGANSSLALSVLPAPPLQFTARAATTNRVTLTWVDNCTDEDSYIVERALSDDYWNPGEWTRIATLRANSTRYDDTSVSAGLIYWYRVRAHNRWGNSAATTTASQALGLLPPPKIGGPYASIGSSNCVNLQWNNYIWVEGIPDGYEIQRAPDAAGSPGAWSDIGSIRTRNNTTVLFTDPNVAASKTYWYRLRGYNVFGVSEYTDAASVALVPPPVPDWLMVSPFADRMDLNWYVGSSYGFGLDAFSIERAPDLAGNPGVWSSLATMPAREPYSWSYAYSDAGHDLNTTWWYRVRTHNWIGYGPYSTPVSGTTVLPAVPAWLSGWIGASNQINLQWQQYPSDQNGFRIERAPDAGGMPGSWSEIGILQLTNTIEAYFTDKQVTALTTNWYRVRAFNRLGISDYSDSISVAVTPPPPPNFSVTPYRDQFQLYYYLSGYHFDAGNFGGYKIERAPDAGGSPGAWTQIAQTTGESFTDSGYDLDATWWYRVRAFSWAGDGDYSPAVSATIQPPGVPDSLAARIGTTNQVELSWSDSHYDQDGFRLERAPDAGGTPGIWTEIAVIPDTNSYYGNFTDTNVTSYTTNWYRLRAFNVLGASAYGDPASVAVIPPPPPTYSGTSANRDQVDFYWGGNYSAYGAVAGFKIERAADTGGSPGAWQEIGQTAESHFVDSGRSVNTTWWYRARAFNWIGKSEPSPVASATIKPPAAPEPIYSKIGVSNQIDLTWNQSWDLLDEDGFRLERASDISGVPGIWTEIAVIPATNAYSGFYSDTNVIPLSTNWYRVRAFNVVGNSDYGPSNTIAAIPPEPPHDLSAAPSRDQVNLRWDSDYYYANYGFVEGFKIERAPDIEGIPSGWSQIGAVALTNPYANNFAFQDSGRELGSTWWYRVRAFNWTGDGDYSSPASATIVPPAAPDWINGQIGSTNQVNLSWYRSSVDADGFRLERASDDNGVPGVWTEIAVMVATNASYAEFTDTNVTALTTNWYRVRAFNLFGNSDYAEPVQLAVVPPPAPYYAYAQAYRDRINLSWGSYHDGYGVISGFKIERAPDVDGAPGAWSQVAHAEADSYNYSDSNLVLNTTWWYRVRAYNWVGDGEPSQEASATILPPGVPYWVVGRVGSTNQVKLTWYDFGTDEDGFRVERAPDEGGVPGDWTEIAIMAVTNVSDVAFTDTNVTALTTNWYRVRAFNGLAISDYAVSAAVPILPPPAPDSYAGVYRDQVNLSWSYDYYNRYGVVGGFQLERAPDVAGVPGDWSPIATVAINNSYDSYFYYTDPSRPVNTRFWYRVRAFNWVGEGDYSPAVSATTVPPATPNYIYGSLGSTNQINLIWYDYSQDEDGFQLERAPDTNGIPGAWAEITSVPAPNSYYANYTDTNVSAYTTNWYRVRAYSALGASEYCTATSVKAVPPEAPVLHDAGYSRPGHANLYWSPNEPAQGSELERATNTATGSETWASVIRYNILCASFYEDTNIVAGGSYAYRAKAFNWVGDSPWSPVVVITIPAATPALTGIAVSSSTPALHITSLILTNHDVLITWEALGDTTNVVQAATSLSDGFADISEPLRITGPDIVATNFLDAGALTNSNRRFYRIKEQ